jgi:hypothetical protein
VLLRWRPLGRRCPSWRYETGDAHR